MEMDWKQGHKGPYLTDQSGAIICIVFQSFQTGWWEFQDLRETRPLYNGEWYVPRNSNVYETAEQAQNAWEGEMAIEESRRIRAREWAEEKHLEYLSEANKKDKETKYITHSASSKWLHRMLCRNR